jgi:phospholipid/cholesterol/gamma-HCH transport system substrate-binding protein
MNNAVTSGKRKLSDDEVMRAVPPLAGVREFRVGMFVILGIVGFITVLFMMTSPALFRGRYMLVTEVPNAHGIRSGDPVRMRGINIGRVYSFELAPSGGVYITMEVEGEYRVPAEARTELTSMGVLGGMVVSVIPGDDGGFVETGDIMPGETITDAFEAAGDLAGDASDVMGRIQRFLSDSTLAGTGEAVLSLRDVLEEFKEITDGRAGELGLLIESLQRSAGNVEGITGAEDWSRTLASAESAMATLQRTSTAAEESIGSLNVILGRIERGEGTLGKLIATDEFHTSMNEAAQSLKELLDDIRENPGRYVTIEIF